MQRWLIILGITLVVLGLAWPWLGKLGLGRLPGDVVIERENFRLYVPITTSLVASGVISVILWLIGRRGGAQVIGVIGLPPSSHTLKAASHSAILSPFMVHDSAPRPRIFLPVAASSQVPSQ